MADALSMFLSASPGALTAFVALSFGGLAVLALFAPTRLRHVPTLLLVASTAAIVAATLTPGGSSMIDRGCATAFSWRAAASRSSGEFGLNVVLFVPFGLALATTTRRALRSWVAGAGLIAMIELAQGSVSSIGRACDVSDVVANGIGLTCGVAAAALSRIAVSRAAAD